MKVQRNYKKLNMLTMKVDGRPSNNVYLRKASVLKRAVIYEAGRLDAAVWATQFG